MSDYFPLFNNIEKIANTYSCVFTAAPCKRLFCSQLDAETAYFRFLFPLASKHIYLL